jgi:hypothetical protein
MARSKPQDLDTNLESQLTDANIENIIRPQFNKKVLKEQVTNLIKRISAVKGVSFKTALIAVSTKYFGPLHPRGNRRVFNAVESDTLQVEVLCPETRITTEISRYDITMALQFETVHKTIRYLAEAWPRKLFPLTLN